MWFKLLVESRVDYKPYLKYIKFYNKNTKHNMKKTNY